MSGGTSPDPADFRQWMRQTNRRIAALETRRPVSSALNLLGPGFDSTATLVSDWNDDTAFYNGMYYSEVGTQNAPDPSNRWLGFTVIDETGSGFQVLDAVPATDMDSSVVTVWATLRKRRYFNTPEGATRIYSPWVNA